MYIQTTNNTKTMESNTIIYNTTPNTNTNNTTPNTATKIKIKPTDKACKDAYKQISNYPFPCEPIRYPRLLNPSTNQYQFNHKSSFHDLIHANMQAIVPSIELGLYYERTHEDIEYWIHDTKAYIKMLNDNIQHKCNKKLKSLKLIKKQAELSKKLDINNIINLPDEIVNHIHGFLLPETRIELLLARHPIYLKNLEKLTSENLKKYLRCIQATYMKKVFEYDSRNPDRHTCIGRQPDLLISFSKKQAGVEQLQNILTIIRNAVPKSQEFHRYYQQWALRLLQSMVYISTYKMSDLKKNKKQTTAVTQAATA